MSLIADLEGYRNAAYQDSAGHWTIGYGSRTMPSGQLVRQGAMITLPQATQLLAHQAEVWALAVNAHVEADISENQAAALISYTHNLGSGVLAGNTMIEMINAGDAELAARQFGGWIMVGGQKNLGVARRRELERRIYLGGTMAEHDTVWRMTLVDLLPAYKQAFLDAAAWHHAAAGTVS